MTDHLEDDLRDALTRMSGAVRPTVGACDTIHAGVRRSRRRRALGTAVGTAGLVVAVAAGGSALTRTASEQTPVEPVPVTSSASSASPVDVGEAATEPPLVCYLQRLVVGDAITLAELRDQKRVVGQVRALSSVQVRHAETTPIGVVALVVDDSGDADLRADPSVVARLRELGVAHVREWDPAAAAAGTGAAPQVRRVITQTVRIAVRDGQECRSGGR
ncbi:hypothetical protein [Nocardioides psychrotolerans]|uniref:hypothetical protein n=1 Tax=Nocardioides psychrotolerans TaxID=1005945 RepID=UPI003137AA73